MEKKVEEKTSFYKNFEKISNEISDFSKERNLKYNSEYNSYFLNYSLSGEIESLTYEIKCHKKLKSTFTGIIPSNAIYEKISEFEIESKNQPFKKLSIQKNGLLNSAFKTLKSGERKKLSDDYFVHSKNKNVIETIISNKKNLDYILSKNIAQFEVNNSGKLNIKLFHFFETKSELAKIIETIATFHNYFK